MLLKEIASIKRGRKKKSLDIGDYPVYGGGKRVIGKTNNPQEKGPAILVSAQGTSFNIKYIEKDFSATSSVFIIKSKDPLLVYCSLLKKRKELAKIFFSFNPGKITKKDLSEIKILEDRKLIKKAELIHNLIKLNKEKIENLKKLRNSELKSIYNYPVLTGGYIGEFASIQSGFLFSRDDFSDTGALVIKGYNLNDIDFRINLDKTEYSQKELPEKYRIKNLDVIMLLSGSVGKTALYTLNYSSYLNQRLIRLRVSNYQVLDPEFLLCWASNPLLKRELKRRSTGELVKGALVKDVLNQKIRIPKKEYQRQTVSRINKINKMLEYSVKKQTNLEKLLLSIFN